MEGNKMKCYEKPIINEFNIVLDEIILSSFDILNGNLNIGDDITESI